jgi:hypothetical protein
MKRISYLFVFLLLYATIPAAAQSGRTGKLRWNISDGNLTVSGIGAMPNYEYKPKKRIINSPWYSYRNSITNVIIGDGVSSIGDNTFYFCDDNDLTLSNSFPSLTDIYDYYADCSKLISVTISNSVTSIGRDAFRGSSNLSSIDIPSSVANIGSGAFSNCHSLTAITIPNLVTIIEGYVFDSCIGLTSVTIPNSVTSIKYAAFRGCHGLTTVTIPSSVTFLVGCAFQFCKGLTTVTILGGSTTTIEGSAFSGCDNLKEIIIHATEPPKVKLGFSGINKKQITIFVPETSIDVYKTADGWKDFENIKAIQ